MSQNERLLTQLELNSIILRHPGCDPAEFHPVDKSIIECQDVKTSRWYEAKYDKLVTAAVRARRVREVWGVIDNDSAVAIEEALIELKEPT